MLFLFHRLYTLSFTSLNHCLVLTTIKYIAHSLSSKFLPYEHVFRPKVRWRWMASRQTARCCPTSLVTLRLSSRPTAYSSVQHHHTSVWQSDCQTTILAKHRPRCDHEIQGLLCDTVECQTKRRPDKKPKVCKIIRSFLSRGTTIIVGFLSAYQYSDRCDHCGQIRVDQCLWCCIEPCDNHILAPTHTMCSLWSCFY